MNNGASAPLSLTGLCPSVLEEKPSNQSTQKETVALQLFNEDVFDLGLKGRCVGRLLPAQIGKVFLTLDRQVSYVVADGFTLLRPRFYKCQKLAAR